MIIYLIPKIDLPPWGTIVPCMYIDTKARPKKVFLSGAMGAGAGLFNSIKELFSWTYTSITGFIRWKVFDMEVESVWCETCRHWQTREKRKR